ncbi:hypothetical protein FRC12_004797 [Ceratobasidium sp. 428]|nr:hypothetical protein FRC12_004797 [Ceratobasidium sp. 428]
MSMSAQATLKDWKTARKLLAEAIRSYQDVCVTLRTFCALEPRESHLADILTTIDSELVSLEEHESTLLHERTLLCAIRNRSPTLVHINRLPLDVLIRIFELSITYCTRNSHFRWSHLSDVCTSWRRLAIHTPSLWSHVDIDPIISFSHVQLLLSRSQNHAISVHIHEGSGCSHEDTDSVDGSHGHNFVEQLVQILKPHIHRVHALGIKPIACIPTSGLAVLRLWLEHGDPALSKSLSLHLTRGDLSVIDQEDEDGSEDERHLADSENAKQMLQSISAIRFYSDYIPWNGVVYSSLVELHLENPPMPIGISAQQIYEVLSSSSPILEVLKLGSIAASSEGAWVNPEPIVLTCLKVLGLIRIRSRCLPILLAMMTLPTECSVALQECENSDELQGFFSRSRIVNLEWRSSNTNRVPAILSLLPRLPCLRTLVLREHYAVIDSELLKSEDYPVSDEPNLGLELILLRSTIDVEFLEYIISRSGIRNLRLECCQTRCRLSFGLGRGFPTIFGLSAPMIEPPTIGPPTIEPPMMRHAVPSLLFGGPSPSLPGNLPTAVPERTLEDIRTSLLEIHPGVECTISDIDSTKQSPLRTFDWGNSQL